MPALSVDVKSMPNIIEAQLTFSYARLSDILRLIVDQGNAHDDELSGLRSRIDALEKDNASLHQQLRAQSQLESTRAEQDRTMQQVIQNVWDEMGKLQAGYKEVQVEQEKRAREQRMQKDSSAAAEEAARKELEQQLRKTQDELKMLSSTTAVLYAFYGLWGPDDTTVLTLGARHGNEAKEVENNREAGRKGSHSITTSSHPPPLSEAGKLQHASGASVTVDGVFEHDVEARTDYVIQLPAFAHMMDQLDIQRALYMQSISKPTTTTTTTTATTATNTSTIASPKHASATPVPAPGTATNSLLSSQTGGHRMGSSTTSSPRSTVMLRQRRSSMTGPIGEAVEGSFARGMDPASAERVERLELAVKELEDGVNGVLLLASHLASLEEVVDGMQRASETTVGGAEKFSSPVPTAVSSGGFLSSLSPGIGAHGLPLPPSSAVGGAGGSATDARGAVGGTPAPKWTPTPPPLPSGEGGLRGSKTSSVSVFPPILRSKKDSAGGSELSTTEEGSGMAAAGSVRSSDTGSTMTGRPQGSVGGAGDYLSLAKVSEHGHGGGIKPQLLVPSGHPEMENGGGGGRLLAGGGWMNTSGTGFGCGVGGYQDHLSMGSRSSSLFPTRYLYPPTRLSIDALTTDQPHVEVLRRVMAAAESERRAPPSSSPHAGDGRGGDGGGSRMKSSGGTRPTVVIPLPEEGLRRRVEWMEENLAMLELKKADRSEVSILEEALRQLLIHAALARGTPMEVDMKYPQMPNIGAIAPGRPLYVSASGSVPLRDGEKKTNATISTLGYESGNPEEGGKKVA